MLRKLNIACFLSYTEPLEEIHHLGEVKGPIESSRGMDYWKDMEQAWVKYTQTCAWKCQNKTS